MKTDNYLDNNILENIFKEVSLEDTSIGFTENLMKRIEKEVEKEKKKARWVSIALIAAGILGILFLPGITLYFYSLFIPEFEFVFSFPKFNLFFDPMVLMSGFSVLFLLILDMLFRKHHFRKRKE